MTRRPHDKPVRIHGRYTADDVAGFVSAHKKSVREWIKKGLPLCDEKRPLPDINDLILERIEESRINDHE
jgi:hypothetical protein